MLIEQSTLLQFMIYDLILGQGSRAEGGPGAYNEINHFLTERAACVSQWL